MVPICARRHICKHPPQKYTFHSFTFLSGVDPRISYNIILLSDAVEPRIWVSTGLNFKLCILSTPHVKDLIIKTNDFQHAKGLVTQRLRLQ